ncbi:MAG TPA: hypothetical protein VHY83_13775 [Solirubrobacteraceae bacterium]|jgi:AcrR family transcriptional regulator|nr:hypothetical protein [Solirubrobacteraceae bacterium]
MGGRAQEGLSEPDRAQHQPPDPQINGYGAPSRTEIKRARILKAMGATLIEGGIEHTTVTRVLTQSKIPRAAFYALFEGREDCVRSVIATALGRAREHTTAAAIAHESWGAQARAGLSAMLELFEADPDLARLCVIHSRHRDPATVALRKRTLEELVAFVAQGRRRGARSPGPLAAEGTVHGVLGILEASLGSSSAVPLTDLLGPLMSFIVLPYAGVDGARRELRRRPPTPSTPIGHGPCTRKPQVQIRNTYRTALVLAAIATRKGMSNREVAEAAGVTDPGQISTLLKRLAALGLLQNTGAGRPRGQRNAWRLTPEGEAVLAQIGVPAADGNRPGG